MSEDRQAYLDLFNIMMSGIPSYPQGGLLAEAVRIEELWKPLADTPGWKIRPATEHEQRKLEPNTRLLMHEGCGLNAIQFVPEFGVLEKCAVCGRHPAQDRDDYLDALEEEAEALEEEREEAADALDDTMDALKPELDLDEPMGPRPVSLDTSHCVLCKAQQGYVRGEVQEAYNSPVEGWICYDCQPPLQMVVENAKRKSVIFDDRPPAKPYQHEFRTPRLDGLKGQRLA